MAACKAMAMMFVATLGAVGAIPRPAILQTRIADGECSETTPVGAGTYFPATKQITLDASMADLFEIHYSHTYKVVIGKMAKEQYVLTQCGQAQPSEADINNTAPLGVGYIRKYFTVPIQSAIAESTVQLGFLQALGVQDRINYVAQYASGPCWQKALGCGASLHSKWTTNTTLQAERTQQLAGVDVAFLDCSTNCDALNAQENAVHLPASQEDNPLKTAEYIKFVAAFFNKDPEAEAFFAAAKIAYNSASSAAPATPPVVAWVAFQAAYPGYNPDQLVVSTAAYKMKIVTDAGGANFNATAILTDQALPGVQVSNAVWNKPAAGKSYKVPLTAYNDSLANASAALFSLLGSVDVLIDETYAVSPALYDISTFYTTYALDSSSSLKFVQDGMVIRLDRDLSASNGLDWFESRMSRPERAVEGLARILHNDTSKSPRYFRNIGKGEAVKVWTESDCSKDLPVCSSSAAPAPILLIGDPAPAAASATGLTGRGSALLAGIAASLAISAAVGM